MGAAMVEEQIHEETRVMQDLTAEETLEAGNSNPLASTAAFLHVRPQAAWTFKRQCAEISTLTRGKNKGSKKTDSRMNKVLIDTDIVASVLNNEKGGGLTTS